MKVIPMPLAKIRKSAKIWRMSIASKPIDTKQVQLADVVELVDTLS